MARKKGTKNPGAGRPKGAKNKSSERVRNAIAAFADQSIDKFIGWIEQVAEDDPKAAADLFLKTIEYHIPKLARTEIDGNVDHEVVIQVMSNIGYAPNSLEAPPPIENSPQPQRDQDDLNIMKSKVIDVDPED